jgi:hypothetical protein
MPCSTQEAKRRENSYVYRVVISVKLNSAETTANNQYFQIFRSHNNKTINNVGLCNIFKDDGQYNVNIGLLGCNSVWTCRQIPTFQRNILLPSSGLKYVPLKCWYPPTSPQRYNPEQQH